MGFDIFVPWMFEANDDDGEQDNLNDELTALWWNAPATCTEDVARNACDYTTSDRARCYIERQNLTCAGAPYDFGVYSFRAQRCGGPGPCGSPFPPSCGVWVDRNNLPFVVTAERLGCPVPRKEECQECLANVGSGMEKTPVGGGPACAAPIDSGPGATLRYAGGGVGQTGLPGTAEWAPTLGRNWSHEDAREVATHPLFVAAAQAQASFVENTTRTRRTCQPFGQAANLARACCRNFP